MKMKTAGVLPKRQKRKKRMEYKTGIWNRKLKHRMGRMGVRVYRIRKAA